MVRSEIDQKKKTEHLRTSFFLDNAASELIVQSDHIHLFDSVNVNTCPDSCNVEDIVGTVELYSNGIDSGCKLEQCCMCFQKNRRCEEHEIFFFSIDRS